MSQRVVFLDRDGVLNWAFPDGDTTRPPRSLTELKLLPGVPEALTRLHMAGFLLVVVTNQPDVARGQQTRDAVEEINQYLQTTLPLLDVFVCYHDTPDRCPCRKPKPGLLHTAARQWNLDLATAYLIGDRWSDIAAAHAAGCRAVLIKTPFSNAERCAPDHVATDIVSAVDWILATETLSVSNRCVA